VTDLDIINILTDLPPAAKGKAIPLQAWKGLEVSGRLRLQNFKTIGT
jgi:hypothetical protein